MVNPQFYPLTVSAVEPETDSAIKVSFEVPEALREHFRYRQGQYLTLRREIDGEEVRRSYSICAGLDDGELRVGEKRRGLGHIFVTEGRLVRFLFTSTPSGTVRCSCLTMVRGKTALLNTFLFEEPKRNDHSFIEV